MATWRDQFSTFMSTWSASSDEEEDGEASSGEENAEEDARGEDAGPRKADKRMKTAHPGDAMHVEATLSDAEAQLSYPGTDDEEFDGGYEDACEDAHEEDPATGQPRRRHSHAGDDPDGVSQQASNKGADEQTQLTFRDILMGKAKASSERPSFDSANADAGDHQAEVVDDDDDDDEWETDDGADSDDVEEEQEEEVAEEGKGEAAKKPSSITNLLSKAAFPGLPPRAKGPSLPSRPAASAAPGEKHGSPAGDGPAAKPAPSRPTLPARGVPSLVPKKQQKPAESEEDRKAKPADGGSSSGAAAATPPAAQQPEEQQQSTPAGGGSSSGALSSASALVQPRSTADLEEQEELSEDKKRLMAAVMEHRVKLLRVARRLGVSGDNHVVRQVVFRLDMTEQIKLHGKSSASTRTGMGETFKEAEETAARLEREAKERARSGSEGDGAAELDLGCTVLVIGKSGTGKSTLVDNLLGIEDSEDGCGSKASNKVREIEGEVFGVKMKFIDVPGLQPSMQEAKANRRILAQAKRATKKHMPDIVLYVDRLDVPSYDFADIPLVREISNTFGAAIWWNALIVFTHGGSRAPEDSTGQVANFEYYQNHRGYVVQQMIRQAAGDARILNPVSVVECHHSTERNEKGEKLLPNGQAWRAYILLLCFASKVLHDANTALKLDSDLKDGSSGNNQRNSQMMAFRRQQTPYPLFFNNLFQTRKPRKAQNMMMEDEGYEDDLGMMDDMDSQSASSSQQAAMPGQDQEYPLNPFMQPQDQGDSRIDIPAPDPALAPTFDCDPTTNAHRYRYLENSNGWICRAIVEPDGLEHDDGINGFTSENYYGTVADPTSKDPRKQKPIPTYVMAQVNMPEKDKVSFVAEVESSVHHVPKPTSAQSDKRKSNNSSNSMSGDGTKKPLVTTAGVDVQSLGREIMYVARTETRLKQGEKSKICAGLSAFRSSLRLPTAGPLAVGAKVEERLKVGRRYRVNLTGGAIAGKAADGKTTQYLKGANVQFMVKGNKKKNEPTKLQLIGTAMHWKKEVALGGDVQFIQMVGPDSALTCRANLNSRCSGSVQVRLSSTDTIKYALIGVIPTLSALWGFITGNGDM